MPLSDYVVPNEFNSVQRMTAGVPQEDCLPPLGPTSPYFDSTWNRHAGGVSVLARVLEPLCLAVLLFIGCSYLLAGAGLGIVTALINAGSSWIRRHSHTFVCSVDIVDNPRPGAGTNGFRNVATTELRNSPNQKLWASHRRGTLKP
jgi:hypothetical protein